MRDGRACLVEPPPAESAAETSYFQEADPQARVIGAPIIDSVWLAKPENRRRILSALWAIVRHWDHAGRPLAAGRTRQGFDIWGEIIGGMVEFAGFGDMLAMPKLDNAGDTEADDVVSLVMTLHARGSTHSYTDPATGKPVRFRHRGKGRARRFIVTPL